MQKAHVWSQTGIGRTQILDLSVTNSGSLTAELTSIKMGHECTTLQDILDYPFNGIGVPYMVVI